MSTGNAGDARRRMILDAAAELIEREGARGLSTRAVAGAAGVRPATLYQFFGDKEGLLRALAVLAFDRYLGTKQHLVTSGDPVSDMRIGWDAHVDFGLAHPALYLLMFGVDRPAHAPSAASQALDQLLGYLHEVARAGRLRVPPAMAAQLLQAGVTGTTLGLIGQPADQRDLEISARMRDAVIACLVLSDQEAVETDAGLPARALALDSALDGLDDETPHLNRPETALLRDWLQRLARTPS